MKFFAKMAAASALALIGAHGANAAVVDFEDKAAFFCNTSGSNSSGGLNYTLGFADCYYSPSNPGDFPTVPLSTVMGSGFGNTVFTRPGGGVFALSSVDLGFGPFDHSALESDTTEVVGTLFGGGTISTVLNVGYTFQTYQLGWSNLVSVSFSQLAASGEYLGFDNIVYTAGVPEPASWMLLLAGFGFSGVALRRRRKTDRVVSC